MPSPLAEAFLMGILNGCYETPSKNFVLSLFSILFLRRLPFLDLINYSAIF